MTTAPAQLPGDASDLGETPEGKSESLSASVRKGALWNLASTLLLRLASILITAIVARILDPRDFGIFAVATTAYMIVSSIGEFGISSCIYRADLDIGILAPTMVAVSMTVCTLLAGTMVVFARPIAAALGSSAAASPVRVMALTLIIVGIFNVPSAQLVRDFKQDRLFLAEVISFVPSTALLLLLAKSGSGAMAFAWSRVACELTSGLVVISAVPKNYWPGISRSALSLLYKYGIPLAIANFVNYILLNVDYALVGHLLGATLLGVYVLAFNVASWPSALLGSVINNVTGPAFSRVRYDPGRLKEAIGSALRGVSLIVIPMCSLLMVLARPIVLTLYGVRWTAAASVLSILSLYGAISVICTLFANILAGVGRAKFLLLIQLIWLGALVPAMSIGVHKNGILGAAFAHIAVIAPIVLPSYLIALKRITGVSFAMLAKAIQPALLASLAVAFAAWGASSRLSYPPAQLIVGLVTGGLIYLIAAGPQLIALLTRGKPLGGRLQRILRFYQPADRSKEADAALAPFPNIPDTFPDVPNSISDDFCYVCGTRVCQSTALSMVPTVGRHRVFGSGQASSIHSCPRCRSAVFGQFCEMCGYNFDARGPFAVPLPRPDSVATASLPHTGSLLRESVQPHPAAPPAETPVPSKSSGPPFPSALRPDVTSAPRIGAQSSTVSPSSPEALAPWSSFSPGAPDRPGSFVSSAPPTRPLPVVKPTAWTALVDSDRAYFDKMTMTMSRGSSDSGIEFPDHTAERRIPLVGNQIRIGRRSRARLLEPEIDLSDSPKDPGISRLHAVLIAGPDGSWSLVDSGSANGTLLNGHKIAVGTLVPLHDDDRINLGAWTVITIRRDMPGKDKP